jgi:hypothetical protein
MFTGHIFGIGLSKTGTHTLNQCLETLGYKSIHYPDPALMTQRKFDEALKGYTAATDISVAAYFDVLDRTYPDSKFILTTRDLEPWLDSVEDHRRRREHEFNNQDCPKAVVRKKVYGTRGFDRKTFTRAYDTHLARVRAYFSQRPADLLEINLCGVDDWKPLCSFLDAPVPAAPIPWLNRTAA